MAFQNLSIQYALELAGTGFFAMSGALVANKKSEPDWFGVTFIAFITSIGGGSIRDLLIGSYPLVWVSDVHFIYVIVTGIVLASVFYTSLTRLRKTFFIFDTLGISLFTILGTEKALHNHVHVVIAAIMGMFSAIMGGVLRDVLTNETPIIFRKEIYATACLAGSATYIILVSLNCERTTCLLIAAFVIVVIRVLAVKYQLSLPKFRSVKETQL